MAARYLLDTNVISEVVKDPHGALAGRLLKVGEARLCTSIIVACELRFGVAKRGSPRLAVQLEQVLGALSVLPLEGDVDQHYGAIRLELEEKGQPIGQNDLLIAAHAITLNAVLVTDNVREFRRVPSLVVENWSRPKPRQAP